MIFRVDLYDRTSEALHKFCLYGGSDDEVDIRGVDDVDVENLDEYCTPIETCTECSGSLMIVINEYTLAKLYHVSETEVSPKLVKHTKKRCNRKKCRMYFSHNFVTKNGAKKNTATNLDDDVLFLNTTVAFSLPFLSLVESLRDEAGAAIAGVCNALCGPVQTEVDDIGAMLDGDMHDHKRLMDLMRAALIYRLQLLLSGIMKDTDEVKQQLMVDELQTSFVDRWIEFFHADIAKQRSAVKAVIMDGACKITCKSDGPISTQGAGAPRKPKMHLSAIRDKMSGKKTDAQLRQWLKRVQEGKKREKQQSMKSMKAMKSMKVKKPIKAMKKKSTAAKRKPRMKTFGWFVVVSSDGAILYLKEMMTPEQDGKPAKQAMDFVYDKYPNVTTLVYDRMCKHLNANSGVGLSPQQKRRFTVCSVDKMHGRGHNPFTCSCNPWCINRLWDALKGVNTSRAESVIRWLNRFARTANDMQRDRQRLFMTYIGWYNNQRIKLGKTDHLSPFASDESRWGPTVPSVPYACSG